MGATSTVGMRQIGEVAAMVGLSVRTIRHWDEVGLAPPSGRSSGGFRLYTDIDVDRLRLIRSLKPLDLSLEEICELLDIRDRLEQSTDDAERASIRDQLSAYAARAEDRCGQLRAQLDEVEVLARRLRAEADGGASGR